MSHAEYIQELTPTIEMTYADPSDVQMNDIDDVAFEAPQDFDQEFVSDYKGQSDILDLPPACTLHTDTTSLKAILNGYEAYPANLAERIGVIAQRLVLDTDGKLMPTHEAVARARIILEGNI